MGEARPQRVFFALWPDAEAAARLSALARDVAAGGGRAMRPETLHMTLAFVGAVTATRLGVLRELAAAVAGEAFDLRLDHLGYFPRGGIAWAGCSQVPSRQRRLFEQLRAALQATGFVVDARTAQVPHVTLARRVHPPPSAAIEAPIGWRAREFVLVESQLHSSGADYRTLARFPLAEAPAD